VTTFLSSTDARPEAVLAVDDAGVRLTYGQIDLAAAEWLRTWGPKKKLVLLLCENTCAHLEAYFGLLKAGHAVILIGAGSSEATIAELVDRHRPDAILNPDTGLKILEGRPDATELHPVLAVLLSTSGSTGSPKLARFSLSQMDANAVSIAAYLNLDADERPLAHLPFHYSYGLSIVHSHAAVGATLLLTRHSMMSGEFWHRLEEEGATSLSGVPFHFEMLLKLRFQRRTLTTLTTLTQAGGRLGPDLVSQVEAIAAERGWRFYVMYGQTEAGPRISYVAPDALARKPGSIGGPIPGVRMSLVSEDGSEVSSVGQEGELIVESPAIMMGYADDFADMERGDDLAGRLVTGDLAMRDSDGDYTIVGRKSRFIKLQGNRVNLADVEQRLTSLGFSVACVGEDDHLWIASESDDEDHLRQAVVREFTFPSRSTHIARVEALPRSEGGKVLYRDLLGQFKESAAAAS
jgi:acyl-coenzyme A synthetase/AMP-(fatty) acid ligase